jgi:hypothetical protein
VPASVPEEPGLHHAAEPELHATVSSMRAFRRAVIQAVIEAVVEAVGSERTGSLRPHR